MNRHIRRGVLGLALLLAIVGFGTKAMSTTQLPANRFVSGKNPENITVDVVDKTMHVTATGASMSDFGSGMQTISSRRYAGKRVRFAAEVKSADIIGSAGLWMRVDGQNREVLAFNNMQSRPITGTTDWRQYSIVLPVSASARDIAFGIFVSGSGEAWMRNLSFRSVASSVSSTAVRELRETPNLDLTPVAP